VNNTIVFSAGWNTKMPAFKLKNAAENVEMHNNVFYRVGNGPVSLMDASGLFPGTKCAIAGSNNAVPARSAVVPREWTATRTITGSPFVDAAVFDFTPLPNGPLSGTGSTAPASPPEFPFPSSLKLPQFMPPRREALLGNKPIARSISGAIDIGAFGAER
jgi:hypothetical protein